MFVFSIFIKVFVDQSLDRNFFRFSQIWSKFYFHNSTYSHIQFYCIVFIWKDFI